MNARFQIIFLCFCLLFVQGCTNTLYHGEIKTLNADNQKSNVVLYWTKTEPFIGKNKAGPAKLLTECSTRRLEFVQREDGIYFFGTPGLDIQADQATVTTQHFPCGKIVNKTRFTEVQTGPLNIEIKCMAEIDDFVVTPGSFSPAYIKARQEPYTFEIMGSSNWSFFGEIPEAPSQPECRRSLGNAQ
jgi:hypothetical protein